MSTPSVIDLHCDTILEVQGGADVVRGNPDGHVDVPRLREGRVGLQVFACFVTPVLPEGRAFDEACALLDLVGSICDRSAGSLVKVESRADAEEVSTRAGATAVVPAVENGHAIEADLRKLERIRRLGARYMTLTHAKNLSWAASSGEPRCGFDGLTRFGEKVVAAMNEMGLIVDVSHVHESTFWHVARVCRRPFIASHSNASALCGTPRNLTDDQIRAVAASGGMIGINFYPGFLDGAYAERQDRELGDLFAALQDVEREHLSDPVRRNAELRRLYATLRERMAPTRVGMDRIIDHVEHVVRLVGDEHVGFGSDFDGIPDVPEGVPDCAAFPRLLARMGERGFTDASIERIVHGNFLRVLGDND